MVVHRWILLCVLLTLGGKAMAVDEPPYRPVVDDGAFAVRDYPALLVAEVTVTGDQDEAGSRGFRLLAAYIFGANTRKESIAMTAPVVQSQQAALWTVRFIMPQGATLESLPAPKDARVHVVAVAPTRVAVVRFSGLAFERDVAARTAELRAYLASHHWSAIGPPRLARYNPPWTPWFMRRNEVMIPIEPGTPP